MSAMPRVLIGGVGYRWMRDASFGLVASDALAREQWPDGVEVADLGYGALYVALDLLDARPPSLWTCVVHGMHGSNERSARKMSIPVKSSGLSNSSRIGVESTACS